MSTLKRFNLLSPGLSKMSQALPTNDPLIQGSNFYTTLNAFKAWVVTLSDILYNNGYSEPSILHRCTALCEALVCFSPSSWIMLSKDAYDIFIDFVSLNISFKGSFYVSFKDRLYSIGYDVREIDALVAPIARVLSSITGEIASFDGCWKSDYRDQVELISQYLGFLTKLVLDRPDLEEKALADYIDFEENYPGFNESNPMLPNLKSIILGWLGDFRYDGSLCRHGNGAVANCEKSKFAKYTSFSVDTRLCYLYNRESYLGLYDYLPLGTSSEKLERTSKLEFVPKNVSKLRSISMEPASLQFVQQGVMRYFYDYFENHKYLDRHIKLYDQTQNKAYAYDGSITNNYATIDLSSASDSVSYDLCHYIFGGNTEVWRWLVGTRSDHTLLPDGRKFPLKKFAPMGSAVCFPIETLIFAGIAELAVTIGHEMGLTRNNDTGVYNDFYTVYGDDIIVPLPVYNITVELLSSFGFKINREKSYANSPFKESCGGNYFCGRDITPVRYKLVADKNNRFAPDTYSGACSLINYAYEKGLKVFRCFLLHSLDERKLAPLFTNVKDQSPQIYSTHATNFHLRSCKLNDPSAGQWSRKRLYCTQLFYTGIKATPLREAPLSSDVELILYDEWLRKRDKRSQESPLTNGFRSFKGVFCFDPPVRVDYRSLLRSKVVFTRGSILVS